MTEPTLSRRRAWAVALAATLTMTVSQIDRSTLAVMAPSVTKALSISEVGYGWMGSMFFVAYLLAAPLSGWWLDRIGARRGLVISVLLWSAFAALHALALGFLSLAFLRIALGVAESPSYPGSALTVQRVVAKDERARGFGVLFTGSSVGVMLAAPLATTLFSVGGWRVAFLGSAIVGLLWVPIWISITRDRGVRALLDVKDDAAPSTHAWHRLVRDPVIVRAMIAVVAAAPLQVIPLLWGAKYLVRTFAIPQAHVARYLWIPLLAFDLASVLFGDLAVRTRKPRPLFAIAMIFATGIGLLGYATSATLGMILMGVGMFGSAGMYTLLVGDLLPRVPPDRVALASSFLPAAQSFAFIVTSPLIGLSVERTHGYAAIAVLLGLWVVPGALAWLLWRVERVA